MGQFLKNYRTFYQKNCQKALKNMVLGSGILDPRSGIRKKPIPDPGSRGQKGTGSRIRIRNTASFNIFFHSHFTITFDETYQCFTRKKFTM